MRTMKTLRLKKSAISCAPMWYRQKAGEALLTHTPAQSLVLAERACDNLREALAINRICRKLKSVKSIDLTRTGLQLLQKLWGLGKLSDLYLQKISSASATASSVTPAENMGADRLDNSSIVKAVPSRTTNIAWAIETLENTW